MMRSKEEGSGSKKGSRKKGMEKLGERRKKKIEGLRTRKKGGAKEGRECGVGTTEGRMEGDGEEETERT